MHVSTRIEIVKLHYSLDESATTALRGYKTKHGLIKDPFTVSTITRLIANFESTGFVLDFPGKGRKSLSDEKAPIVQNAVEQLQFQSTMVSSSITQVSQLTVIPRASVHRIMRRHLHHPTTQTKTKSPDITPTVYRIGRRLNSRIVPIRVANLQIWTLRRVNYALTVSLCMAMKSLQANVQARETNRQPPGRQPNVATLRT
ncbi:hypothetical protein CLF_111220 [Clonorchis sinensis]|uniref:DUF4817 domain-containing protein n=1 Tax=Clonorchis sinensis TaxID=79923 RepID=G7YLI2_CLOSI|nr:hypothetical protein CLF_111220 [Clonorchis sinensis]